MDNITIKRYEMFKRVNEFGNAQASAFVAGTLTKELFGIITQVLTELESQGANQSSGLNTAQSTTATKAAIREELRDRLLTINRTARVMALKAPGFERQFRFPRAVGDQVLLNAARAFAADAAPIKDRFIQRELPADFIEQLHTQIDAFEDALKQRTAAVGSHMSARVAIDESVARGLQTVRELDVILRNKFTGEPVTLAAWAGASQVARRAARAAAAEASPSGNPGNPPVPPTAQLSQAE